MAAYKDQLFSPVTKTQYNNLIIKKINSPGSKSSEGFSSIKSIVTVEQKNRKLRNI